MLLCPNNMSMNTSWRIKWAGELARMGQLRILVRNSENKGSLGRTKRRWKQNNNNDNKIYHK
jgi:hypothetical protein